jgi:hypothetical protein
MSEFICNNCKDIFKTKQQLERHESKKNKCTEKTNYQCDNCHKYFRSNYYLKAHQEKCNDSNLINKIPEINKIEQGMKAILKSSLNDETKIELLCDYKVSLNKEKIKTILNSDMSLDDKILQFCNFVKSKESSNINNGTINSGTIENSNNVTTNIQINNFGQEKIDYLDHDYFKNLIMNQHIEKGYVQLIKDIYLNNEHPENKTVKVENINNKYALVFNNDKWDTMLKSDLKEMLHKKNYTVLKMHYDKLKKSMSVPKREETYSFLKRDETGDPHMMYVIDKIILLFYNDGEVEDLPEKYKINKNI